MGTDAMAVTDSAGQFRIEQLRGGQYTVTFSLTGFGNCLAYDTRAG